MSETVWLIERKYNSVTHYFSAYVSTTYLNSRASFRTEPETALRFARKEDAEMFLKTFLMSEGAVHEHTWVDPSLSMKTQT